MVILLILTSEVLIKGTYLTHIFRRAKAESTQLKLISLHSGWMTHSPSVAF